MAFKAQCDHRSPTGCWTSDGILCELCKRARTETQGKSFPCSFFSHYHSDMNDLKTIIHYLRSQTETLRPRVWISGISRQTNHPSLFKFLRREVKYPRREGKVHSELSVQPSQKKKNQTKTNKKPHFISTPDNLPFQCSLLCQALDLEYWEVSSYMTFTNLALSCWHQGSTWIEQAICLSVAASRWRSLTWGSRYSRLRSKHWDWHCTLEITE